jgi:hypothetical protein
MKLHEQRDHYKSEAEFLEGEMISLLRYVHSAKFHDDKTVQTSDIILRISESLNKLTRGEIA